MAAEEEIKIREVSDTEPAVEAEPIDKKEPKSRYSDREGRMGDLVAKGTKKQKRGASEKSKRKERQTLHETQPVAFKGMFDKVPKSQPHSKPKSRSSSLKKESPQASGSGKLKNKNQYLGGVTTQADYKSRAKGGVSSLMDMKKFKAGDFEFSSKVTTQHISFGNQKSNYRDRTYQAAEFPQQSPFLSKTLKGVFGSQPTSKKKRRESAKGKKRAGSKKAHLNTSHESIFSPKQALFNSKKLSYGSNQQIHDAISRGKKKVYSRNQGLGVPKEGSWRGGYGGRFKTQNVLN